MWCQTDTAALRCTRSKRVPLGCGSEEELRRRESRRGQGSCQFRQKRRRRREAVLFGLSKINILIILIIGPVKRQASLTRLSNPLRMQKELGGDAGWDGPRAALPGGLIWTGALFGQGSPGKRLRVGLAEPRWGGELVSPGDTGRAGPALGLKMCLRSYC